MCGIETAHEAALGAHHPDRHAAGDRLAVDHHVGRDAEVFLGSARRETKAGIHFVENQRNVRGSADLAQARVATRIAVRVESWGLRTSLVSMIASLGGGEFGWKACTGLTSTAGELPGSPTNDRASEAGFMSLSVRQSPRRALTAQAGLHAVPPAVIGPGKAGDLLPAGC